MKTPVLAILALLSSVTMHAQQHSSNLIPVATFGSSRAIGVGVSSDNRVFVSFPAPGKDNKYGLTEIIKGKATPFPDEEVSKQFTSVQDLFVDAADNLWVLDPRPFKLFKINLADNKVEKIYTFDDLDKTHSGLNDVRVDIEKQLAYLSDPGAAAIVVLDLQTGKTRIVLHHHPSTQADTSVILTYDGKQMRNAAGKPFVSNVNGIALTKDNRYFYYKPINKRNIFRIATKYLADASMSGQELAAKVEVMSEVGVTHGLEADRKGNILLSTSTDYSVKYLSPDGKVHTLVQDARLLWPDSFGIGTDGYLYLSCAQLQRDPQWNNGVDKTELPYTLFKVKLP